MAVTEKKGKAVASDLEIASIGVCAATPAEKKSVPCVVIAYMAGAKSADVRFTAIPMPAKGKLLSREDILAAVGACENVKNVTYRDENGLKDIYVCREQEGRITDFIERDYGRDKYPEGFSEIASSYLRFTSSEFPVKEWKTGVCMAFKILPATEKSCEKGSREYAVVNAFNACLLGRLFEKQLALVTKTGRRVRVEVRQKTSEFIDDSTLFVKPEYIEAGGLVNHYTTEEFQYIDGAELSTRSYKIQYTNRLSDYILSKN